MDKYEVIAIAYRDIEDTVVREIRKNSIKDISSLEDLEDFSEFCRKGVSIDNRVCIYVDWFKDDFKEKIKEKYHICVIEMPHSEGIYKPEFLELLDEEYGDELLLIGKVKV